jgi:hypothetical protein
MTRTILMLGTVAGLNTATWAAPEMAELAPSHSLMVMTAPSVDAAKTAIGTTPLMKLWETPRMRSLRDAIWEDAGDSINEMLEDLGIESEDKARFIPDGMIGAAVFVDLVEPETVEGAEEDEWYWYSPDELLEFGFIMAMEHGEHGDDFEELMEAIFERWGDEDGVEISERDHGDATITVVESEGVEGPSIDDVDPDMLMEDFAAEPMFPSMYFTRVEDVFLVSSNEDAIKQAIDRLEGDETDNLAREADYVQLAEKVGTAHMSMIVRAEPIWEAMEHFTAANDEQSVLEPFGPLGLRAISGMTFAVDIADDESMVTQRYAVLVEGERRGLLSLPTTLARPGEFPGFVDDAAVAATHLAVDFRSIPAMVSEFIESMPEEDAQMAQMMWMQLRDPLTNVCTNMEPDLVIAQWIAEPFGVESQKVLMSAALADVEPVVQVISSFGLMMGMQERDYRGHRLFDLPEDSGVIGFGGGRMLMGAAEMVEGAFQTADRDDNGLIDMPEYRRVVRMINNDACAVVYTDIIGSWAYSRWALINSHEIELAAYEEQRRQLLEMGISEDDLDEWMEPPTREDQPAWYDMMPTAEDLRPYFGPGLTQIRITDDGFEGESYVLYPSGD